MTKLTRNNQLFTFWWFKLLYPTLTNTSQWNKAIFYWIVFTNNILGNSNKFLCKSLNLSYFSCLSFSENMSVCIVITVLKGLVVCQTEKALLSINLKYFAVCQTKKTLLSINLKRSYCLST